MSSILLFAPIAPYAVTLIVFGVVLGVVALWLITCAVIAAKTLDGAVHPTAHTIDEARIRQSSTENIDLDVYDKQWDKRSFELDGLHGKLSGEMIVNPADKGQRKKVAVICHGYSWNRINSLKYAQVFYKLGFNLVIYDHSYFGLSEGKFCTLGFYERHDLSKVIDYAREQFGEDCIVALHGESMGAVTVLTELGIRDDVDMVVADCPFSHTLNYYGELFKKLTRLPSFPVVEMTGSMAKMKYGYDYSKCNPIDDVRKSNVPICFIHGKSDDFIYPHHSEDMYAVCNNPLSELHLVDSAAHACSYMTDNEGYFEIVKNFVDKVLNK
ncbi:MAG: alpha/beta hydrolase [Corallococcus sp.]|nr:alpha/beta hydrolase [Corallococcus sp.]